MSAGDSSFPVKPNSLIFRVFEFLLLASLLIFTFLFGAVNLWAFSLGAAILCGTSLVFWTRYSLEGGRFLKTSLDPWLLLYFVCFSVSLVFSKIPFLSWIELFKLIVVLNAFWITRYLCRGRAQIRGLAHAFVFFGAFLSIVGLLQFVGALPNAWWAHKNFISSMYVNHNHFAGLLVLVIPIAFGLILSERDRSKQVFLIFMSVLMGIAFVFALSRGAFLALGLAMAFMVAVLMRRRLVSSVAVPFMVFVALVICAVAIFGTESIQERLDTVRLVREGEELSFRFRWMTWLGALQMIRHFFWFGSGPGTFDSLFLLFRPEGGFSMRPVYAHNDYLHLLAECGIFAFASTAALVFVFFRKGYGILLKDDSRLRIGVGSGVLAGVLGALIHALFDFNFHIPANWLLLAVAAGLLFSMDEDRFYAPNVSAVKAIKAAVFAVLAGALFASFYFGPADYRLWMATKNVLKGHRAAALRSLEKTLPSDTHNAEYYYLRGITKAAEHAKRKSAVEDFDRAIRLNPYEPAYDFAKARALAPLLAERSPWELTSLFENAVLKDPNNSRLAFLVAREVFSGPRAGRQELREWAGAMLSKRRETLSGLVECLEKEDLWKYHRKYHLKLSGLDPDSIKKQVPSGPWGLKPSYVFRLKDLSIDVEGPAMVGDMLFRNAELKAGFHTSKPLTWVVLNASGTPCKNVFPSIYVKIDGKLADEYYVDSDNRKNYFTGVRLSPGEHTLSLEYVNDLSVGKLPSQDRNVFIYNVSILES